MCICVPEARTASRAFVCRSEIEDAARRDGGEGTEGIVKEGEWEVRRDQDPLWFTGVDLRQSQPATLHFKENEHLRLHRPHNLPPAPSSSQSLPLGDSSSSRLLLSLILLFLFFIASLSLSLVL